MVEVGKIGDKTLVLDGRYISIFKEGKFINRWAYMGYLLPDGNAYIYRRKVHIKELSGNTLTDYQIKIVLGAGDPIFTHARSAGEDIRFCYHPEEEMLSYWIEKYDPDAEEAIIWVKVPEIPANSEIEIYMYYGNPTVASASDGEATFEFFDDFDYPEGDLDGVSGWQDCGNINAYCNGDGTVTITSPSDYVKIVNSKEINLTDWIIEYKGKFPTSPTAYDDAGVVWRSDYLTSGSADLAFYFRKSNNYCEFLRHTSMPGDEGTDKKYIASGITMDNNYHIYKIIYTSDNRRATAYVDDTQVNQQTFSAEPAGKHCGLFIHEHDATEFIFDWIRVRKYASPEPSVSVGAEE